jgi:hypothetical protein
MKVEDLTGRRFGNLVVVCRVPNRRTSGGYSVVRWRVKCDCGAEKELDGVSLRGGVTRSCGCLPRGGRKPVANSIVRTRSEYLIWIHEQAAAALRTGKKICARCNNDLAIDSFHRRRDRIDGRESCCKTCRVESVTRRKLKYLYGLYPEDVKALIADQGGLCAICQRVLSVNSKQVHVDHDHATNRVRGILCHRCNLALGLLDDDANVVKAALEYLLRNCLRA